MSIWIDFLPQPEEPGKKTKRWIVVAKQGGVRLGLGLVRWYAPWRQYTFQPVANTIYDRECLRVLAEFCNRSTKLHFQNARAVKAAANNSRGLRNEPSLHKLRLPEKPLFPLRRLLGKIRWWAPLKNEDQTTAKNVGRAPADRARI